jgi:hypothetical protein
LAVTPEIALNVALGEIVAERFKTPPAMVAVGVKVAAVMAGVTTKEMVVDSVAELESVAVIVTV